MGPSRQTAIRPRPILVIFPYLRMKSCVCRNAYKLKTIESRKNTFLSDDMSPEQQSQRRDFCCLHALARSKGFDSKLRGDTIVIENDRYNHSEINCLPHKLTLENAKIVRVQDGYAFQSHHAFLSSLFECDFEFRDRKYTSAEKAFHHVRAEDNTQPGLAKKILETENSYEDMRTGKKIQVSNEYREQEPALLKDIHLAKFRQNPNLRNKLTKLKGHLYEATHHPVYGSGYSLAQKHLIKKENVRKGNKLGEALENILDNFIKEGNN